MNNCTTKRSVLQRRRSSASQPDRTIIRERNRIAANKCRQRKKREHQQIERRLSDEIERKEVLLAQLDCLREEAWELKNMVFQHAGCENQQIDLQLARMMRNILNDPSKGALPIYEADSLPPLSCGTLSDDSAVSDQQPDAINADTNNKNDWTLFSNISDGLETPNLEVYPDSMFDNFVNVAHVYA
ncbi:hypothetical protein PITC_094770 [Penicillium italicum]|uniref:BZIP domain-containing protein n=1 Tax=Penicillium italicum TaxID=40296 RepID=A0A0A2KQP2_PENIT|nr:hypothetical protein PITC_094770 [Penicillium italicum]